MTRAPVVDKASGSVALAQETFEFLIGHAVDPTAGSKAPGAAEQMELLSQAGLIGPGGVTRRLAKALAAVVEPTICKLELHQSGKAMQAWADTEIAALLLPTANDGRRMLSSLHPSLLPEALARLVDLGPRPRPPHGQALRAGDPRLERLLAGDATRPLLSTSVSDPTVSGGSSLASHRWRRWRMTVEWSLDDGRPGRAALEAIDTADGIWLLEGDEHGLIAWPVSATDIWRMIGRLIMRRAADEPDAIAPPDASGKPKA